MDHLHFTKSARKASENARKHGVTFAEAQTAFSDEAALLLDDPDHSEDEDRFLLLGRSAEHRLVVVSHCYPAPEGSIRLISARLATRRERKAYTDRYLR